MRRAVTLLLAVVLAVGACSKDDRPTLERVSGSIGASDDGVAGDVPAGGADGEVDGATTSTAPVTTVAPPRDESARVAAADAALAAYLDALQAEDFAAAQAVSSGGARFMAQIRDVVARYNAERDGVSTLKYSARSFRAGSTDATSVAYVGSARLDSTVSGPAGDPYSESALFENPVVSFADGRWVVSAYLYNGQPLANYPAESRDTVGGVALELQGALTFGASTGVVIDLVTDSDHAIKVEGAQLTYADGSQAPFTFGALISRKPAALYYLFDASTSRPVRWSAKVTIDSGTTSEISEDVVLAL